MENQREGSNYPPPELEYLREVWKLVFDKERPDDPDGPNGLRAKIAHFAKAKPWAHTADRLDLTGIAIAALAIKRSKPPPAPSPADKATRKAVRKCHVELEAARVRNIAAIHAAHGDGLDEWMDGRFLPIIEGLKSFLGPAPMTRELYVARKVLSAIEMVNRMVKIRDGKKAKLIPTGRGSAGAVIFLTNEALGLVGAVKLIEPTFGDDRSADRTRKHLERRAKSGR
jgi:hypothetical protein